MGFFWFIGCNFNKFKGFSGFLSEQVQTSDYCTYLKNVFKCQLFSRISKRKRMLLVLWRKKDLFWNCPFLKILEWNFTEGDLMHWKKRQLFALFKNENWKKPLVTYFLTCYCMFIRFPSHSCWSTRAGTGKVATVGACLLSVHTYLSKLAPCN